MRLLCDTQIVLWFVQGAAELRSQAKALIVDPDNDILFSTVSLWEVAIKVRTGKLRADVEELHAECTRVGMQPLRIEVSHLAAVSRMIDVRHLDPFDHLLIAQATIERVPLLTADRVVQRYPINIIKA